MTYGVFLRAPNCVLTLLNPRLVSLQPIQNYTASDFILKYQSLEVDKPSKYLGFVLDPEIVSNRYIDHLVLRGRKRLTILKYISDVTRELMLVNDKQKQIFRRMLLIWHKTRHVIKNMFEL
ncbi:hypothetical protein CEXT_813451 [Caerostris extrusa]|uniref:Uncharacterized protein n=1 Tax=Caerostris extrusa TaxID=172846 RepID=A0AAV4U0J0_CAEEX|nr:hypothetical protein CEXT_813451 [Caerostris extrusa]